ncbi:DsbA family protein [Staphylococcus lutrae]|uniref:Protein-disulfide isomerase n=1 Tax=Staphylococcus lutrae TaxID=155085 RepID=A0AAC9RRB3_9STAP|nr:thioredoxin domain-containing protein [Staphylococcus lutrae]ARJ50893.1 protein-disulfide isomerase [Staphylococcus lutrae]PNZ34149.1 protein-disulfide isomerase [Staphylococcus lutrae]
MTKKKIWMISLTVVGVIALIIISLAFLNQKPKNNKLVESQLATETQSQPVQGKKGQKVLLVEFGDYKCPYCGDFERHIKPELEKKYINNDKVEFRYVNVLIHGEESVLGAKAALAVNQYASEQYWTFHHLLYQAQPKNKDAVGQQHWLTDALIQEQLQKLNITDKQRQQIISAYRKKTGEIADHAQQDHALAKKFNVPEVPSLFINGKRVADTTDVEAIDKEIDRALDQ